MIALLTLCLFTQMAEIESGNNNQAIGAAGERGIYQIQKIFVDDVNRIVGEKMFTYADRLDTRKSRCMIRIWWAHYKCYTLEQRLRMYNGGPKGMEKGSTLKYWRLYNGKSIRSSTQ